MSSCPRPEKWQDWLKGGLSASEQDALSRHRAECAACANASSLLVAIAEGSEPRAEIGFDSEETVDGSISVPEAAPSSGTHDVETVDGPSSLEPPASGPASAPETAASGDAVSRETGRHQTGSLPTIPGYEILEEIGRGGMGVVYKARQVNLKRTVALKTIRSGTQADPEELARFRTEAEAVARLQHANIVHIHEIGEHQGLWFISLEFVEGGTLARKGQPPFPEAARLVETLARAMHHAHERGIIHRDLKPVNVLLTEEGTPKITDFGLAKHLEADSGQTRTGAVMGTPSYMAPEQAAGESKLIGPLTDVYALGAILYELITGKVPFKGTSVLNTLELVRTSEPIDPAKVRRDVPRDLGTICLKAMAKEPAKRYASALALANDLARFLAGEPILARRAGVFTRGVRHVRRHRAKVAMGAVVLGTILLAGYLVLSARHSNEINRLETQLLTELDADDWSASRLQTVDGLLATLELEAPAQAEEIRARVTQRLERFIQGRIRRPVLQEKDVDDLQQLVTLLAERDAKSGEALSKQLDARVQRWQTVLNLATPFEDLESVFDVKAAGAKGNAVSLHPAPVVWTRVPSKGNVEMNARFAAREWADGDSVGLLLHGREDEGYGFTIAARKPRKDDLDVAAGNLTFTAHILRNGLTLRKVSVPELGTTTLTLRARCEGNRLTLQVNALDPIHFIDPFPLPLDREGRLGIVAPGGAELVSLQAQRLTLPPSPSALQKGDSLHEEGKFGAALAFYRDQALSEGGTDLGHEARFKEGLCLLALKQPDDAARIFEELSSLPAERWAVLGTCHLWLLHLERKDLIQAEAAQERLVNLGLKDEYLSGILPDELRTRLKPVAAHPLQSTLFRSVDENISKAKREFEIHRILAAGPREVAEVKFNLGRAYQLSSNREHQARAVQIFEEIAASFDAFDSGDVLRRCCAHLSHIHIHQKEPARALSILNRWLSPTGDPGYDERVQGSLLTERARVHVAMKNFKAAEADIERVLPLAIARRNEHLTVEAFLVKGFLRHMQGDSEGAIQAWREGRNHSFQPTVGDGRNFLFLNSLMLGGLSGELSDEEIVSFRANLANLVGGQLRSTVFMDTVLSMQPLSVYRGMWRTPKGMEIARSITMRDCGYIDYGRLPAYLMLTETARHLAFSDRISDDQDALLWELMERTHAEYLRGGFKAEHLLPLGLTLKGNTFLWPGLSAQLDPRMRGHLAYLLGMRYLRYAEPKGLAEAQRKQRLGQAREFFRMAASDAAGGSVLEAEVRRELKKLER